MSAKGSQPGTKATDSGREVGEGFPRTRGQHGMKYRRERNWQGKERKPWRKREVSMEIGGEMSP